MTATIKPPDKRSDERRALRLSSMEILGFSDAESTWSDSVPTEETSSVSRRGRHEATVADLIPEELGGRLTGGNIRWGLVAMTVLLVAGLAGLGYWIYQRPQAQEQTSLATLTSQASALQSAIPALDQRSDELLTADPSAGSGALDDVERAARSLFATSSDLGSSQVEVRTAASQASGSALDGVRLTTGAGSYRAAVVPMLAAPELETDPELIELDEAARQFGDWQLSFDNVRTALPDAVLPDVNQQLDILSGDLPSILGRYVDALREDDTTAADEVMADLGERLGAIRDELDESLAEVQTRVDARIEETRLALDRILGD